MLRKVALSSPSASRSLPGGRVTEGQVNLPFSWDGNWGAFPTSKVRRPQRGAAFAWAHTYTAFSLEFAKTVLAYLGAVSTSSVLDPFVGSGTTIVWRLRRSSSAAEHSLRKRVVEGSIPSSGSHPPPSPFLSWSPGRGAKKGLPICRNKPGPI